MTTSCVSGIVSQVKAPANSDTLLLCRIRNLDRVMVKNVGAEEGGVTLQDFGMELHAMTRRESNQHVSVTAHRESREVRHYLQYY
jgi:hypothetical protein